MSAAKIVITLDPMLLKKVDRLIKGRFFRTRSQFIQVAVQEMVSRLGKARLMRECAMLNMAEERTLAEEGIKPDAREWPEY